MRQNRHRGRRRLSKSGESLYREMRVRVVMPGQKDIVWRSHPKPGHGYSEADLEGMLERAAEYLEKHLPSCEFRMVELAPNSFNFIYERRKETMNEIKNPCPVGAQSASIAEKLCAVQGHKIGVFQQGMELLSAGMPVPKSIIFCQNCGFGLGEIRGEAEKAFNQAVQDAVRRIVPAPPGATAGPFPTDGAGNLGKGALPIRPDSISPKTQAPEDTPQMDA